MHLKIVMLHSNVKLSLSHALDTIKLKTMMNMKT